MLKRSNTIQNSKRIYLTVRKCNHVWNVYSETISAVCICDPFSILLLSLLTELVVFLVLYFYSIHEAHVLFYLCACYSCMKMAVIRGRGKGNVNTCNWLRGSLLHNLLLFFSILQMWLSKGQDCRLDYRSIIHGSWVFNERQI